MNDIQEHNKWAKDNIKFSDQMICEVCGRIVAKDWMKNDFREEVGNKCALCFDLKGEYQVSRYERKLMR